VSAIGAGNPAGAHTPPANQNTFAVEASHRPSPGKLRAGARGVFVKQGVQRHAAQAQPAAVRKIGGHVMIAAQEMNAAERRAERRRNLHADTARGFQRVRHEPFAAGFVNGRPACIGHQYA